MAGWVRGLAMNRILYIAGFLLLVASTSLAHDTRFLTEWAIQQNCVNLYGHTCPEVSVYGRTTREQLDDIELQNEQLRLDLQRLENQGRWERESR